MLGSAVSLIPAYVIKRGTCSFCKQGGKDAEEYLIPQGALFWQKGKGQYMKKFHFQCYVPKFGGWNDDSKTQERVDAIAALKEDDQALVNALFSGELRKKKTKKPSKKKKRESEEGEEEDDAGSKKGKANDDNE